VQATHDALSLTGRVRSQSVAERAAALVAPMAKSVVDNLEVVADRAATQILLRVRFAELDRSASSSFGVSLVSTGALNMPARTTTGQFPAPSPQKIFPPGHDLAGMTGTTGGNEGTFSNFSIGDALNIFAFRPDLNLAAFVKSLRTQGVLQILAEPNLVTTNGKEASFLVGGEFPVPIVQGGAAVGAVTIQFREFGIRLTFLPTVTSHKTIKLHVKPEVSSLDFANGVVLSGFTIPGLTTRRMETHIELGLGQSFVIAGLIDDRVTENLLKVPGLAKIPILGALFRSKEENRSKTELIVMVTPEITDPLAAAKAMPAPVLPKKSVWPSPPAAEPPKGKGGERK
jgi:pilus assembly protein CpaC